MVHRKKKNFQPFLWHRRAGLLAIVLVVILAITGIMLNHTETIKLDENYVESGWLLNWYGLEPAGEAISYNINGHRIAQWDNQLFFDDQTIMSSQQILRGVMQAEQFIVIALDSEIILLSNEGELIERMPTGATFSSIIRLGTKYQRATIETADTLFYMADEHMLDWDITSADDISWSATSELNEQQLASLRESFRGKGLSMERVVLDLHSGRILGSWGIYLMDAAAIALLWLSFSGWWVWWSRRKKQRQKRHYQKHHRG